MRFTKRRYSRVLAILEMAMMDAWLGWSERNDDVDYAAFKILYHKHSAIYARALREGKL